MKSAFEQLKPQARTAGLVIQELPDELLVYDLERDKAHCLNQTAAVIWKSCDGKTSVSELAGRLASQTGLPADEEIVWLAIEQMRKANLLGGEESEVREGAKGEAKRRISRREVMRRVGIGAMVALPLVTSIIAPNAYAATSCPTCVAPFNCPGVPGCTCSVVGQPCFLTAPNSLPPAGGVAPTPGGGSRPRR